VDDYRGDVAVGQRSSSGGQQTRRRSLVGLAAAHPGGNDGVGTLVAEGVDHRASRRRSRGVGDRETSSGEWVDGQTESANQIEIAVDPRRSSGAGGHLMGGKPAVAFLLLVTRIPDS
jgi:hypothetical protein